MNILQTDANLTTHSSRMGRHGHFAEKHHDLEVRNVLGPEQGHERHGHHDGSRRGHGLMRHHGSRGAGRQDFVENEAVALAGQQMNSSPGRGAEARTPEWVDAASSQPPAQFSGVCLRNCKACGEPVCVRTGTTRNRRSI